jgi:hypothetical protein
MYWNIFHDFTLKLTSPEFQLLVMTYDIMFFAETDNGFESTNWLFTIFVLRS